MPRNVSPARRAAAGVIAAVLAGCSHDGGSPPAPNPGEKIGGFDIRLVAAVPATKDTPMTPAQTVLLGGVRTGPIPPALAWKKTAEEGPCRLLEPSAPFCDPGCAVGTVCQEGGRCAPQPEPRSGGSVRIKGLRSGARAADITVQPMAPIFDYQFPAGLTLDYPPFAPGDTVEVAGSGGAVGAFKLVAPGIAPLALLGDATVPVERGQPAPLRWQPGGEGSAIHVALNVSMHGGTKGVIECDTADRGSLDIPAALITRLLALGTAGFPSVVISRSTVGITAVPGGHLELTILSEIDRPVTIPGQPPSCLENSDCPPGLTCAGDRLCR